MKETIRIIKVRAGRSNVYFIKNEKSCILIDAGYSGLKKMKDIADTNEIDLKNIDMLILTHTHYDHVNLLYDLNKLIYTEILVHAAGERYLKFGQTPNPSNGNIIGKFILALGKLGGSDKFKPVVPDTVIDGEYNTEKFGFDLKILPTPGHTKDSISIIVNNKFAFVGDTLFNIFPGSIYPIFVDERKELKQSWRKLLDCGCDYYFPGHGKKISYHQLEKEYDKLFTS